MVLLLEKSESDTFCMENYRFILYNIRNVLTEYKNNCVNNVEYDIDDLVIDMTNF